MSKNTILKNGGGELANQLWNYISIHAYSLEIGATTSNPSFFEYHYYFRFLKNESLIIRFLSLFFKKPRRRNHIINKIFRFKYKVLAEFIARLNSNKIVSSINSTNKVTFLPPTVEYERKNKDIYFLGWLFRNPIGIEKYRQDLIDAFKPIQSIENKINNIVSNLKNKYKTIIGLHIRQGDYKTFKKGKYFIEQKRIVGICNEYISNNNLDKNLTLFVITSDGQIDTNLFASLNIHISKENAVTDLFLLSSTNIIIGSDSSFGHFASWYGNIPHIVIKNEMIDWEYYKGKTKYFINKYLELLPL